MQGDSGERTRGRGRGDRSRGGRGGRYIQQGPSSTNNSPALNYDDEGDNLYNPLQRPAHFAANTGRSEPPQEQPYGNNQSASVRGSHSRYGDQQNQHNTNRGSFTARGMQNNSRGNGPHPVQPNYNSAQAHYQSFPMPPSQAGTSPQTPQWPQYPSHQSNVQYIAPGMPPPFMMPGFANMSFPPPPPMPSGGFINPNFFPNQQNPQYPPHQQPQQGQQYQHNQQNQNNPQHQPRQ